MITIHSMVLVVELNDIPNLREYLFDEVSNEFDNSLIQIQLKHFQFYAIAIAFLCAKYYDAANLHYVKTIWMNHTEFKMEMQFAEI